MITEIYLELIQDNILHEKSDKDLERFNIEKDLEEFIHSMGKVIGDEFIETVDRTVRVIRIIGFSVLVFVLIFVGHKIYKRFFSDAAQSCRNSDNKNVCMINFRIKAIKAEITYLKSRIGYCNKSTNPQKCKQKILERIRKKERQISKELESLK
jgi:hypothetical protein